MGRYCFPFYHTPLEPDSQSFSTKVSALYLRWRKLSIQSIPAQFSQKSRTAVRQLLVLRRGPSADAHRAYQLSGGCENGTSPGHSGQTGDYKGGHILSRVRAELPQRGGSAAHLCGGEGLSRGNDATAGGSAIHVGHMDNVHNHGSKSSD